MTERNHLEAAVGEIVTRNQYPGVLGRWSMGEHTSRKEFALYPLRFTQKTELVVWRVNTGIVIEEAPE